MRLLKERFVAYGLVSLAWGATSGSGCAPRTEIGTQAAGAAGAGATPAAGGTAGDSSASGNGGTSGKGGASGKGGSSGKGGTSGKGGRGGSSGDAGMGGTSGDAGMGGTSGDAGTGAIGGIGTGGTSGEGNEGGEGGQAPTGPDCFDPLAPDEEATLEHGPNNAVFPDPIVRMVVENYAGQTVFSTPSWELRANFPDSDEALNTALDLPDELDQVPDNVGEILIARPVCAGESTAGRTIRIHAHWQLDGAIVASPTEGVALGTTDGASFSDATIAYTRGEPDDERPLNRLNPLVLEHTFDDDVDPTTLVLRLWLLDEFAFPSTFYVNRVEWE